MKILVTNDDGIAAEGLAELARLARDLGEVTVVAPREQCSAMSSRITLTRDMTLAPASIGVEGIQAYSLSGTPVDCVRATLSGMLPLGPDLILSGVNDGPNCGFDAQYSATVGAGMEGLLYGVPAICTSMVRGGSFDLVREALPGLLRSLLARPIAKNRLWNINFPGGAPQSCKGILEGCLPAQTAFFDDRYHTEPLPSGGWAVKLQALPVTEVAAGTDTRAILDGYISVGQLENSLVQ